MTLLLAAAALSASASKPFVDYGPANKFIEPSVHVIGGGSTILHNYRSTFGEIENLNTNMGILLGAGGRATFGFRDFFGVSTEFNILARNYNIDMSVVGHNQSSMSAVFINSRTWSFSIPLLLTFRFNVADGLRWNVDAGAYYSYGFAGTQRQRLYVGRINELGQLVAERIDIKSDYYNSPATFQNSFRRSDWGIHIGTSLDIGRHIRVGARLQAGLKNTSFTHGISNPRVRNLDIAGMVGWRF